MVALTKISSNIIALLIILFITIFRTVNRRYGNPLILLTLSKKLDFMFFQKKSSLRESITKMTKIFGQKKGFLEYPIVFLKEQKTDYHPITKSQFSIF